MPCPLPLPEAGELLVEQQAQVYSLGRGQELHYSLGALRAGTPRPSPSTVEPWWLGQASADVKMQP